MTDAPLNILIIGASYGALIAAKVALAGHRVTLVGREDELTLIERQGVTIDMPFRGLGLRHPLRFAAARDGDGNVWRLCLPDEAMPERHDLCFLAVQEPQADAPELIALFLRIASARLPVMSLMNLAPLSYLRRITQFQKVDFTGVHAATAAWRALQGVPQALASPDAQAVRPDPAQPGLLRVTLPTNFKCAPFDDVAAQSLLARLAHDIDNARIGLNGHEVAIPVRLVPTASIFTPFAKVPMLIAGNCRSILANGEIPISEAIWQNPDRSRASYDRVCELLMSHGAPPAVFVPFDRYAAAARALTLPSSAARALANGAVRVERVDLFVRALCPQESPLSDDLSAIVATIESRLARNRAARSLG